MKALEKDHLEISQLLIEVGGIGSVDEQNKVGKISI